MMQCPVHGPQPMLHVSWDVLRSLYVPEGEVHLRRIDIFVDGECCFTFILSPEYCEHVGLAAIGDVSEILEDETAFNAKLTWEPDVKPCCGQCFFARFPNRDLSHSPRRPAEKLHGYVLTDLG